MTVTVEPDDDRAIADADASLRAAFATGQYQGEVQSFQTIDQLLEVFTPRRLALIQKLQTTGPSSLRGLARALGRDVKRVHEDAAALLEEGIIERNADKKLVVPFERIHIDVDLIASTATNQAAA